MSYLHLTESLVILKIATLYDSKNALPVPQLHRFLCPRRYVFPDERKGTL
ncbi:hypothetical protein MtrunA17_Chr1g0199391 [Medicago truncatula]|uniref:Uncharacterized protein n=1 Tax=Medicago truncatula TaxID=3880 RepID=A0A396JZ48_MEDTR|nr:hypothetical protein MtrunA17_Chr1g0199391 [Medicago truncatula]